MKYLLASTSIYIYIIVLINFFTVSCKFSPDRFHIDSLKIKIVSKKTKQPLDNIIIYHLFIYNMYKGCNIIDSSSKHVVINKYYTVNGEVNIPESTVYIKNLSERAYPGHDGLIINLDTKDKLIDNTIAISLPIERNIKFTQVYTKYNLMWEDFNNFYKINRAHMGYYIEFGDLPYKEEELNIEYSKYGVDYRIINQKQRDRKYIIIEI